MLLIDPLPGSLAEFGSPCHFPKLPTTVQKPASALGKLRGPVSALASFFFTFFVVVLSWGASQGTSSPLTAQRGVSVHTQSTLQWTCAPTIPLKQLSRSPQMPLCPHLMDPVQHQHSWPSFIHQVLPLISVMSPTHGFPPTSPAAPCHSP